MGLFSKKLKDTKVKLDMYGSQSSGLSLSTSDLDLVLTCQYSPYEFLELIEAYNVLIVIDDTYRARISTKSSAYELAAYLSLKCDWEQSMHTGM